MSVSIWSRGAIEDMDLIQRNYVKNSGGLDFVSNFGGMVVQSTIQTYPKIDTTSVGVDDLFTISCRLKTNGLPSHDYPSHGRK